jgi:hypothetical protein
LQAERKKPSCVHLSIASAANKILWVQLV